MEPTDRPAVHQLVRLSTAAGAGGAGVVELHLPVGLDAAAFDELNAALFAAVDGRAGGRWVLDLTHVAYMGSSMLGLLVNARHRVRSAGGRIALCGLTPWLAQTLHACSLEKLFVIAETRDEALRAVGGT